MLHLENDFVKTHLLDGNFGLEKESLRVLEDGSFAHTPHPFPKDEHIVKDFCENQTEINTGVHTSAHSALQELYAHTCRLQTTLSARPAREYLWPFSNPPYIKSEEDIPVAVFEGARVSKSTYRNYLSAKYGRYKMTFSGIHFNYSFSEELLEADYRASGSTEPFQAYKDRLYLDLAQGLAACGWILVVLTAASPILDGSFVEKGVRDRSIFTGMASVRCSDLGYWNEFAPIFDYSDLTSYVGSMRRYVEKGFIQAPSELYYPIRLKPHGSNRLESLEKGGINHIELRMFDLNPLIAAGVEEKDLLFAQLLIVYIAGIPPRPLSQKDQIQAVQNFKNAARYDLKTVKILAYDGENQSVADESLRLLTNIRLFFKDADSSVQDILDYEEQKLLDPKTRYAWQIREAFEKDFVKKGLVLSKKRQEDAIGILKQ